MLLQLRVAAHPRKAHGGHVAWIELTSHDNVNVDKWAAALKSGSSHIIRPTRNQDPHRMTHRHNFADKMLLDCSLLDCSQCCQGLPLLRIEAVSSQQPKPRKCCTERAWLHGTSHEMHYQGRDFKLKSRLNIQSLNHIENLVAGFKLTKPLKTQWQYWWYAILYMKLYHLYYITSTDMDFVTLRFAISES